LGTQALRQTSVPGHLSSKVTTTGTGTYYKVIYRDSARIAFEAPGLARVIEGVLGQEVPQLLDLLELGDIWEIITQGHGKRV
jgi:hypothetical protein